MTDELRSRRFRSTRRKNYNILIIELDAQLGKLFKQLIRERLSYTPNIPAEVEDIYYAFLASVPKIAESFNEEKATWNTYITNSCRYFARNYVKRMQRSDYAILNQAISYDALIDSGIDFADEVEDENQDFMMQPDEKQFIDSLWDGMAETEKNVAKYYFMENKSIYAIAEKTGISRYKVQVIIKSIMEKISKQNGL